MFSTCVLLYGAYPNYARRVLNSLLGSEPPAGMVQDLRIGINEVCQETRDFVWDFCGNRFLTAPCYVYDAGRNAGKYPLMRRMFYDPRRPLASHVMWFDDDSYLLWTAESARAWWESVAREAKRHTMLGDVWRIRQRGQQFLGIARQPWFTGKPVPANHYFVFCTGGWWTAPADFLARWDYPFPELYHNGGDSILGELVRQQGGDLHKFKSGVVINEGGRKGRRGIAVALRDEVYPWQNYTPGQVSDLAHQNFECRVYAFAQKAA